MPRRYAKKRAPKRNATRHRRPRGRPANRVNNMGFVSGMPKTRRAYLRYSDSTIELESVLGGISTHKFRANSVYDPDFTSAGHQPMGYDNWALLYNHYVVVGCKISIKSVGGQTIAPTAGAMGIYISDDTALPYTTLDGFVEAKRGVYRTMTYQRNTVNMSTTFSAKKFFNVSDLKDNYTRLGATVGANPAEVAMLNVYYFDLEGNTTQQRAQVTIDYIVDFSEPKDLTQS